MPRPRTLLLLAALLVIPHPSAATTANDLCQPAAFRCTIATVRDITPGSILDFGNRPLTIANGGRLDVGAGSMTVRAGTLTVEAGGALFGRGRSAGASGGVITVVTTGDVRLRPQAHVDISGQVSGGTLDVTAGGNVEIAGLVELQGTTAGGSGGRAVVNATGRATVVAGTELRAFGGGEGTGGTVMIIARLGVGIDAPIDATGGDGGTILFTTEGDLTTAVAAKLNVDATGPFNDGGEVDIFALGNVSIAGPITGDATGSVQEEIGGFGGFLTVVARGSVAIAASTTIDFSGAAPDGEGGELDVDAGVDLNQAGRIFARGPGIEGFGGIVTLTAERDLVLGPVDVVDAFGDGRVTAFAGRDVTVVGEIAVDGTEGGGLVEVEGERIEVRNRIHANPLILGPGGDIDVLGCDIQLGPLGRLEADGPGGRNLIQASRSLVLANGSALVAGPVTGPMLGTNRLEYRDPRIVPVIAPNVLVRPQAQIANNRQLPPCADAPPCGNGVLNLGEQCDDFNVDACDGCSPTCTTEVCGNGVVDCREECDSGPTNGQPGDPCGASCMPAPGPGCGDGSLDPANEECDDGNTQGCDGCSSGCTLEACGNGTLDCGEGCDPGPDVAGDCCTAGCALVGSGGVCRPAAGPCDVAEVCNGVAIACPVDAKSTALCRASAGVCDPAEFCDGASNVCPPDTKSTALCRASAGVCDPAEVCDGVSNACPVDAKSRAVCRASAGVCDPAEVCDGVSNACPVDAKSTAVCRVSAGVCDPAEVCDGVSNACPVDAKSTAVCRASAGVCDPAEVCDGVSNACPVDAKSTAVCRVSAGVCDPAEVCDGVSNACPPDAKSIALCRAAAGVCDVAELCDGLNDACPADSVAGAFVLCRPSAGACDLAENCDGTNAACPPDAKSTALCRASAGVCDPAEVCDGVGNACPSDAKSTAPCRPSAGVCDLAEVCDGVSNDCPADGKSTAPCRAAADVCDVAEVCDGVNDDCPADSVAGAFVLCRPSAGACDLAESCDGTNVTCPADAKSIGLCRAAAGGCDVPEFCDGTGDACPANSISGAFVVCRPSAGPCDLIERCDGSSVACPADAKARPTRRCRAGAGVCDPAEFCDGLAASCPPQRVAAEGTACGDRLLCNGAETCQGGICRAGTPPCEGCDETRGCCGNGRTDAGERCDDGNTVEGDCCTTTCEPAGVCGRPGLPGCALAATCDACQCLVVDPAIPPPQRDRDGDDITNEQDNCPAEYNPDQADAADADGIGDVCDLCAASPTATLTGATLQFRRGRTLKLSGRFAVEGDPPATAVDPLANGLWLRVETVFGDRVLDVALPGGQRGEAGAHCGSKDGWSANRSGRRFRYLNRTGALATAGCDPGSAGGISAVDVRLARNNRAPSTTQVHVKIKGAKGPYDRPVDELPYRAFLVVDGGGAAPLAPCGDRAFRSGECAGRKKRIGCNG